MSDMATLSELATLFEWSWARTKSGERLHHVATIEYEVPNSILELVHGVTDCGFRTDLWMPGVLSRMGTDRCKKCCRKLGIPDGVGSPKNDGALRPWVEGRLSANRSGETSYTLDARPNASANWNHTPEDIVDRR